MNSLILIVLILLNPQDQNLRKTEFNLDDSGIAIDGYDPVSYFTKDGPKEGKKSISASYMGVTYLFSSEENKKTFEKAPSHYEPAYGGWCAYAMGDSGEKVKIDPETFKIIEGKIYLFYNFFFNNTLKDWNADEGNLMKKADTNWGKIFKQNP